MICLKNTTECGKIMTLRNLRHGVLVVFGCLLAAIGINMFLVNADLYSGGLSGIAILVQYATKIPTGYTIAIVNVPLVIISFKKLNMRFTVFTIIGTVFYSVFLILTVNMQYIVRIHDTLMYCVCGGFLIGAGTGLAFANHGSMGGFNIITMLIKKKYDNLDVGKIGLAANLVIVLTGTALHGLTIALYTVISMAITSVATDKVIHGLSRKKLLFVVTENQKAICDYINANMNREVTIINGKSLSGSEKNMIYCVARLAQLPELKYNIMTIDENAIISVVDAAEVDGRGFTSSIL